MTYEELSAELRNVEATIESIDPDYAPENYYCDGEISPEEADARWERLHSRREELIAQMEALHTASNQR